MARTAQRGDTRIIAEALQRFKRAADAEAPQRKRELEDLRFEFDPWPEDVKQARGGYTMGGVPVPPRPMLNIPMLDQPIQLVINQEKAAHLGIEIHPESEDADEETAQVQQGLIRHIEVKSRAGLARSWAYERAAKCGRGFYVIRKQWANPTASGPEAFDQELAVCRILNQASVYLDPDAVEPDSSDGRFAFITQDLSPDAYKAEYGDSKLAGLGKEVFEGLGDAAAAWLTEDRIRIAEYFSVETTTRRQIAYRDKDDAEQVAWEDELDTPIPEDRHLSSREHASRRVIWRKINAIEILEEVPYDGQYIPIVPVIGREFNINGERIWNGIIGPAKHSARLLNYAASTAAEVTAIEPKTPWVVAEGQEEGHEVEFIRASARPIPFLRYKPTTIAGQVVPPPERNVAGVNLGPSMALIAEAKEFIHASTFTFDPSLGKQTSKDRSGKAILAQQQQADASNSHYLDNLAQISMTYEAKVLLDMLPKVYDRPGRVARIINGQDDAEHVMLNQPFYRNTAKKPIALVDHDGTPATPPVDPTTGQAPEVQHYDLSRGQYGVVVSIGRSYQTRMQQGSDALGNLLQADPALMPIIGWRYFKYNDNIPGHNEIAEDLKKLRPPPLQDDQGGAPDPKMLMGQLQQMQQQMQQMGKALETEQIKYQSAEKIKAMDLQFQREKLQMESETKIAVAELGAKVERLALFLQERDRLGTQQGDQADRTHDALQAQADRVHEALMAQQQASMGPPNGSGA